MMTVSILLRILLLVIINYTFFGDQTEQRTRREKANTWFLFYIAVTLTSYILR